ncbi:hypothetical protein QN277_017201 [Acacia crassicarpa]|uniref:O-acyltransferase WSD1 C-terminal domain-containing protein n=1 Tax=Acacia crassicarpa TaxID=499986 RepID=A0AAE1MQ79_9FABA|nr:hypothetical protein QN277_017201 [Acacia crassicarpa]
MQFIRWQLPYRIPYNTTLTFSNVAGPVEEISFCGPVTFLAATVYGHPHALTLHFLSYMNKMTISVAVEPSLIPDPHLLCDDLEASLKQITAVMSRKLSFLFKLLLLVRITNPILLSGPCSFVYEQPTYFVFTVWYVCFTDVI